ncbi:hypothetical protein GCM10010885_19500 [Alicyclobacillus cellulosilyticus]|uniref:Uncharacterized protein n=1 Tax=Alicyclobacillus cellulosilyticus TaxID=1003997 RepID=A0A917NLJ5_9BACL|nr:hypothetical protein GCM10010885_19500 [Alicyclobacillus cellulosilyticus]
MVLGPVTSEWRASAAKVYGARFVPDLAGWKQVFAAAGFTVEVLATRSVHMEDMLRVAEPDDVDLASPGALRDPHVLKVLAENAGWMQRNHGPLGYGVFLCRKAGLDGGGQGSEG